MVSQSGAVFLALDYIGLDLIVPSMGLVGWLSSSRQLNEVKLVGKLVNHFGQ